MTRSQPSHVGVGIVGLGRMGVYHLQRLSLREDLRAVTAFDLDQSTRICLRGFNCRFAASWSEFLLDDDVELVLIATPPDTHAPLACESLSHGKHVVVEKPLCLTSNEADAMVHAARRAERMLTISQNRRWDEDFRAALKVTTSGELGELRTLKLVSWQYGLTHDQQACDPHDNPHGSSNALVEFGTHYFDQLLQLVPDRVRSLYAQTDVGNSTVRSTDRSFLAILVFSAGVTAQIEVNLGSPTPLSTGWALTGTKGGYHQSRAYTLTDAGEIYNARVELAAIAPDEFYTNVFAHLRRKAPLAVTAQEARRVVALIEAAQRSAEIGQVVPVADQSLE